MTTRKQARQAALEIIHEALTQDRSLVAAKNFLDLHLGDQVEVFDSLEQD